MRSKNKIHFVIEVMQLIYLKLTIEYTENLKEHRDCFDMKALIPYAADGKPIHLIVFVTIYIVSIKV